ncbi:MAG: OmpA family protein [Cyclobacteriaceae bacterium]|nr:OmpA family protein [Cyclobacteriaceae bacterium]
MIHRLIILLFLFSFTLSAQSVLSTKNKKAIELYTEADNYRVRGQFSQAISLLTQAIERDKSFFEAYYRLGIVYMSLKDYPRANHYFENGLLFTTDPKKQKVFWFDMGESYFMLGEYDKAKKCLDDFLRVENQSKPKIDRANLLLRNITFATENQGLTSKYKLKVLSDTVNAFLMQYFPVLTADQQELIFTRRLGGGPNDDEDLVVSKKNARGRWLEPESISKNINTRLNEGTCTVSADGRKLIFTSCVGRNGIGSCDLYESVKIGNDWTEPRNLGPAINSAEWESQPSLSADGRELYFVSDRRGGIGRRDIWVSSLNDRGEWTKARNMGKPVNSIYDEISPFIHANNRTLYFASNGLTGFGGYDIFFSEKDSAKAWSNPINFGAPINNHEDQFALFITADGEKGYYAHEETKADGYSVSKIYEIQIPEENRIKFRSNFVRGVIRDRQSKAPLRAKIELFNIEQNQVESLVMSDSVSGSYLMVLTQGAEYALYVNKPGYLFKSVNFNYSVISNFEPLVMDIDLEKAERGSTVVLNNIFFEVDKFDLQKKSETELQKLIRFLNENPQIHVEIGGHTDNTGSVQYNRQLSEKRAQSVFNYLMANRVDAKRISRKGYGSEKPVASNETEAGKSQNRRIEFKIVQ